MAGVITIDGISALALYHGDDSVYLAGISGGRISIPSPRARDYVIPHREGCTCT